MKSMICFFMFTAIFFTTIHAQKTYYVSSSQGNDSNNGLTPNSTWKTISKVNSFSFSAGDIIRFKSGESFIDNTLTLNSSNISIKRYGEGSRPVIGNPASNLRWGIVIYGNNITIDSLMVYGSNYTAKDQVGIEIYNASNITIKNCIIQGGQASRQNDNARGISANGGTDLKIFNNEIAYWCSGIEVYGIKPLDIGYNYIHHIINTGDLACGIRVIGGMGSGEVYDYNYQAIVHHNEVTQFKQFGMDGARGANIIFEYNHIHDCLTDANSGTGGGIKIGAWGDQSDYSHGSIFRYNTINDLWAPQQSNGSWSGYAIWGENTPSAYIYGNLIYNIYGGGIVRNDNNSAPSERWEIYNNTIITGSSSIQLWGGGNSPNYIKNNIIKSGVRVAGHSYTYPYPRNATETAQIWHGTESFSYSTTYDIRMDYVGELTYVDANILVSSDKIGDFSTGGYLHNGESKVNLFKVDPLFANETNYNYALQSGSPAINYGISTGLTSDLNGNLISDLQDIGAIEYSFTTPPPPPIDPLSSPNLNVKVFLEGPYKNGSMNTAINGFLPLSQPYTNAPWNYSGNESVSSIPSGVVDWILVELRSSISGSSLVARKAAFLKSDGMVVDLDGSSSVKFDGISSGNYFVVIRHRNHIDIMSSNAVELSDTPALYDFTIAESKAYGSSPMGNLGNDVWGMYAGDGDKNGLINVIDYGSVGNYLFETGYESGDIDMNGTVSVIDYGKTNSNLFKVSQVPN